MPIVSNAATGKKTEINAGETVFDGLEKKGEKLPHGCLSGSCGACKIIVLKGENNLEFATFIEKNTVQSIVQNYKGSEDLKGKTVRLACRAKVKGDIEIKPLK